MGQSIDFPLISPAARKAIQHRTDTKAMQTLLGICTGICADQNINDHEISYLRTWMLENPVVASQWPGSAIKSKIDSILDDGIVTADERDSLLLILRELTGNFFHSTGAAVPEGPAIPIDDDPSIFFKNMTFCFTGQFLYGTRAACERVVLSLGAMPVDRVSKKLDYLVIGSMIEPSWANTTYGRKIEMAVNYRDQGAELTIVSERQWFDAITDTAR